VSFGNKNIFGKICFLLDRRSQRRTFSEFSESRFAKPIPVSATFSGSHGDTARSASLRKMENQTDRAMRVSDAECVGAPH
jgi:hypothetical protein